jgi:RNA polymerase sigma-70 factor (ECF subfamily)
VSAPADSLTQTATPRAGTAVERELVEAYHREAPGLLRYALFLTGRAPAAEDLLQECFLRYFRALAAGERIRTRTAWLYRVMRNCFLARQRGAAHRREVPIEPGGADQERHSFNPEGTYQRHELARQMLRRLAPRELECVRLRAEGLSYAEVAEVLGIRPGTVGALLSRALGRCRALLTREEGNV